MQKIVQLVVLLFLGYLGVTVGLPWVLEQIDQVDESTITRKSGIVGDGEAASCVYTAQQANLYFAREARQHAVPGGDSSAWDDAGDSFLNRLDAAERECDCAEPGCDLAMRAIELLKEQVDAVDEIIRGDSYRATSLARDQERIVELLEEAAGQAAR